LHLRVQNRPAVYCLIKRPNPFKFQNKKKTLGIQISKQRTLLLPHVRLEKNPLTFATVFTDPDGSEAAEHVVAWVPDVQSPSRDSLDDGDKSPSVHATPALSSPMDSPLTPLIWPPLTRLFRQPLLHLWLFLMTCWVSLFSLLIVEVFFFLCFV
jgi:hypothetical protein